MRIHILDLLWRDTGAGKGSLHGAEGAVMAFSRGGDVIGVTTHAIADHLAVNLGTARLGVLQFFQHQHAGTFAHDKAITRFIPGAGRGGWIIIEAGGKGARRAEAGHANFAHSSFGAAGDHHIHVTQRNQPGRIAQSMHAGRAGRHHGMVGPLEAVADGNLAGSQVDQR